MRSYFRCLLAPLTTTFHFPLIIVVFLIFWTPYSSSASLCPSVLNYTGLLNSPSSLCQSEWAIVWCFKSDNSDWVYFFNIFQSYSFVPRISVGLMNESVSPLVSAQWTEEKIIFLKIRVLGITVMQKVANTLLAGNSSNTICKKIMKFSEKCCKCYWQAL